MLRLTDGYYLSAYITIDKLSNVYGVKLINRHDQNIALWEKRGSEVSLVHYWEVERLSEKKHHSYAWYSKEQFIQVMNKLLGEYNISMHDINAIWGTDRLDDIHRFTNNNQFTYHGLCHVFSALMLDTEAFYNETIIALDLDHASDYETESYQELEKRGYEEHVGCVSVNGDITWFPIKSPAPLWTAAAREHDMEEGSLMALASATQCRLKSCRLFDIDEIYGNESSFYKSFCDYYRILQEDEFRECQEGYDERFSLRENKISAMMKMVQDYSIRMMDSLVGNIINHYALSAERCILAIAGGFGLNCPTNTYLLNKYKFKRLQVPPCINDSGQSLGAGLLAFYQSGEKFHFSFGHDAFKGNRVCFSREYKKELLDSQYIKSINEFSVEQAVADIENGPVIWMEGRAEIGPRALGHRSILAAPTSIEIKNRLNTIKQRQFWRPVAPMVLQSALADYFIEKQPSEFMLNVYHLKPEYKYKVPAILHLDGTARVQTITEDFGRIYEILHCYYKKCGIPMICNTSLNDKGEAMIDDPLRAIEFALEKGIDIVYINGERIELKKGMHYKGDWKKRSPQIVLSQEVSSELQEKLNPYHVPDNLIAKICKSSKYRYSFDLTKKKDVELIMNLQ